MKLLMVLFLLWFSISYFPFTSDEIKNFLMRFATLLVSFGLAFFIIAHLQFIPIADRIVREKEGVKEKVKEKTQKSRRFDEKDNLPFYRRGGFPRRKVFAT